jgi:LysM repeat protein
MKMYKKFILILVLLFLAVPTSTITAQSEGPVYIVQPGDTLNSIAERFGIGINDLLESNNLVDPNLISTGTQLIIPSLPEVSGVLNTDVVPFGETIRSLAKRYQVSQELLNKLNRITSPSEVYAGSSLILLEQDNKVKLDSAQSMPTGSAFFDLAVEKNENPWKLTIQNKDPYTWIHNPGEVVYLSSSGGDTILSPISPKIRSVNITPLPISQGETVKIVIETNEPLELSGNLGEYPLSFSSIGENTFVALQGIHAMSNVGLIPLKLTFSDSSGGNISFQQSLLLKAGGFG